MGRGDVDGLRLFFRAEDGIRDLVRSRGLGDVYRRQEDEGGCVLVFPHAPLPRLSAVVVRRSSCAILLTTVVSRMTGGPLLHFI